MSHGYVIDGVTDVELAVISQCPECGGPLEVGQWTGALLCAVHGSDHLRVERERWAVAP